MSTAARIEELRKKFEENPRRYFAPLANELRKAGDLTQAIALCREHLPKQPGHMSGYIVFGQALYESAALDEARAVFEQALGLDPENLIALHHLGHIARQQGDTVGARRWYERALETDPRNDDIAHQLATLATSVRPPAAVPPAPTDAMPASRLEPSLEARLSAVPTPADALDFLGSLPLDPTPDASMRAIDFDTVNASLQQAAAPLVPEAEARDAFGDSVGELRADEAATVEAMMDQTATSEDVPVTDTPPGQLAPIDLEDAFEEGLIADGWPDPAELAERLATPRTVTPLAVDVTPEAAEAFGLEAGDRIPVSVPEPEVEVLDMEADGLPAVALESSDTAVAESEAFPASIADADGEESVVDVADVAAAAPPAEAFDLPWLAAPEPEEREEPAAVAPSVGAAWTPATVPIVDEEASFADVHPFDASGAADGELAAPVAESTEPAGHDDVFARVGLDLEPAMDESAAFDEPVAMGLAEALPAEDVGAEEPAAEEVPEVPAFVTETMGELLVAQGFIDRAVTVYEELVRRRPYDPLLSARLAELREQAVAAPPAPVFTARERFAALAARRVVRRTPARPGAPIAGTPMAGTPMAGTPVAGASEVVPARLTPERVVSDVRVSGRVDSLAALFGQTTTAPDDAAAQALADAFAPVPTRPSSPAEFAAALRATGRADRPATPAYGAVRQPTPASLATVPVVPPQPAAPDSRPAVDSAADFSFDRFFPDPASSAAAGTGSSPAMPPAAPPAAPSMAPPAVPSDDTNEHSATDDLAQFSAWLKGLGKS